MSRNFELLQKIKQEHRAEFALSASVSPEAQYVDEVTLDNLIPAESVTAGMEPKRRSEMLKLVNRLIWGARNGRSAFVFASVEPNDSAIRVTAWASELLSHQSQARVCAIDASLHAPVLHEMFGVPNRGLYESLSIDGPVRSFTQHVSQNLWLVCSGDMSGDENYRPSFNTELVKAKIVELREMFDYVLIGVTNIEKDPQALLLAQHCEGVVLVLEANTTRKDAIEKTTQLLRAGGVRLLGAVLNNREFPIPEAIYQRL